METHTLIDNGILKQHLIDPEICIRCNTCEATCPVNAITHDDNNYVVRADVCNGCMACISPCPTGSIDNWRAVPVGRAYSIEEQFSWEELPGELAPHELVAAGAEPATCHCLPSRPNQGDCASTRIDSSPGHPVPARRPGGPGPP